MEQESKDNNKNKLDGFFLVDDGTLPISKEGCKGIHLTKKV